MKCNRKERNGVLGIVVDLGGKVMGWGERSVIMLGLLMFMFKGIFLLFQPILAVHYSPKRGFGHVFFLNLPGILFEGDY